MAKSSPPAEPVGMARAYLVLRSSGRWSDVFRLSPPVEVVIGRASSNQIVIRDQQASRHHAKIFWTDSTWVLSDLGSVNGTFLNQNRIEDHQVLRDGDTIQVGGCEITFSSQIPGLSHPVDGPVQSVSNSDDQMTLEIDAGTITERRRHSAYLSGELNLVSKPKPPVGIGVNASGSRDTVRSLRTPRIVFYNLLFSSLVLTRQRKSLSWFWMTCPNAFDLIPLVFI